MLSNRESARRSRKRKQEHMQQLEGQIEDLAAEKKEKEAIAEMAERRCKSLEDENVRLREENERLRDELRFLRTEVGSAGASMPVRCLALGSQPALPLRLSLSVPICLSQWLCSCHPDCKQWLAVPSS